MQLAVIDSIALEPSHIERLRALGTLKLHTDIPDRGELERRMKNADIALLGWSKIDAALMDQCPQLKMIAIWATGTDYVDLVAAKGRNIAVANVPGYAAETISEYVIGAAIVLSRNMLAAHDYAKQGGTDWKPFIGHTLQGKTIGIVGYGAIGSAVARKAGALGMHVLISTRRSMPDNMKLGELLPQCDVVTLHASLTPDTKGMIGKAQLALMKPGAMLINTARGEMVDTQALADALASGHLSGAALDVVTPKPLPANHPLLRHPNVLLTPHFAFYTHEAIAQKTEILIKNVESFVAGQPINIVNR